LPSYPPEIVAEAVLNGLLTGAVYGLVALGLTLVYGVLHIINFAHGALLTMAMYAAFVAWQVFGLDPYVAILPLVPIFFALGYAVQRLVIMPASRGEDSNILLVTLGLSRCPMRWRWLSSARCCSAFRGSSASGWPSWSPWCCS
jgi:branched-chain amino acid transport system permease protein